MGATLYPVPGTIKSIQRGVINISGASATATVTAVVVAKSTLTMLGSSINAGAGSDARDYAHIVLTNSTTITATRGNTGTTSSAVAWELVERY